MPNRRYAFGRVEEATHPDSMRATLAELVATFIFVFAGEGSVLALGITIQLSPAAYLYVVCSFSICMHALDHVV